MPKEFERRFWRLIAEGLSTERAAAEVGVSANTGERWFRDGGGKGVVAPAVLHGPARLYRSRSSLRRLFSSPGVIVQP